MQRSVEVLKENLAKVRTGRAHTGLLDQVEVEYWGSMVPVSQVANVTLLDARTIGVKPFESNMAAKVEKAIRDSNLGLNPAAVGDLIRVPMPMLTEERRKDLIKVVRSEAEEGRVSIRNVRRDANDHIKKLLKDKEISEDEARRGEEAVQKLTDKYIAEADKTLAAALRKADMKSSTQTILEHTSVPKHIAVIMDGNGRWAKKRFLPRVMGHKRGLDALENMVKHCAKLGVQYLTVFAFSTENWRRPEDEVSFLMGLFLQALQKQVRRLHENNMRLKVLGSRERFNRQR